MPLYEFQCNACGASVSLFVRSVNSPVTARCERCGSADLRRLVSKFAVLRSGGDAMSDAMLDGLDESDPRAMAAWARRMQAESGEDMGPEFNEMIQRMERGESLDDDFGMDDDHDHEADGLDGDL